MELQGKKIEFDLVSKGSGLNSKLFAIIKEKGTKIRDKILSCLLFFKLLNLSKNYKKYSYMLYEHKKFRV